MTWFSEQNKLRMSQASLIQARLFFNNKAEKHTLTREMQDQILNCNMTSVFERRGKNNTNSFSTHFYP